MTDSALLDALTGSTESVPDFRDIDQRFRLKLRAYVDTAMPPVFRELQNVMSISAMRREGIYPIMYYMQFRPEPMPLAFGRPVRTEFEARLRRYRPGFPPTPGAPSTDRLLLDVVFTLMGLRGSGRPEEMGGPRGEPDSKAGWGRIVQVVTRPFAPPGERQVTELPPGFRKFREHAWEQDAYPAWELLARVPPFFKQTPVEAPFAESVWGIPNTDINQHINITEYIGALENHQTRLLVAAGIDPRKHRVTVTELVFRAPFFAGETYRVWGQLYKRGDAILCLAGIYKGGDAPALETKPQVFTRIEGWLEREGA